MWNKYCVMMQTPCQDGKTNKSELLCCQWDSINEECLLTAQALLSVNYHRRVLAKMDMIEELQQEMLEEHESMAAELEAGLPKAEEFGRSMITKRKDSEAHKT